MASIILFRDIGGILVDVVMTEDVSSELEIPEHPVEKGAKVSDHAWQKGEVITLEAVDEDRAGDMYDRLHRVQKQAEPFDFLSGFSLHRNVLIQTLNPFRDVTTGRVCNFSCTLKQVFIVATQEGPATQGSAGGKGGDARGQAETKRGQVQAVDTTPADALMAGMQAL